MSARFKLRGFSAFLMALAWLPLADPAMAECDLSVSRPPPSIRIDYDPFAPVLTPGALDLEFANAADSDCEAEIVLTDLNDAPLTEIRMEGASIAVNPRESSGLRRTELTAFTYALVVPAVSKAAAQFDLSVADPLILRPGLYNREVRLLVRRPAGEALLAPIPVSLNLNTPARAQLNIAGTAGAFGTTSSVGAIDFGEAETGAVRRAFLQVRANTSSTLTFVSENKGKLAHTELGAEQGITYTVDVEGRPVALEQLSRMDVEPPLTIEGVSLSMILTLGAVEGAMSGGYKDLLTISVSPN